jgi:hypothetical protein
MYFFIAFFVFLNASFPRIENLTPQMVISQVGQRGFTETLLDLAYITMTTKDLHLALNGSLSKIDALIKISVDQPYYEFKYKLYIDSFIALANFNINRLKDPSFSNSLLYQSQNAWIYTHKMMTRICERNDCSAFNEASYYVSSHFMKQKTLTVDAVRDLYPTLRVIQQGITVLSQTEQKSIVSGLRFFEVLIQLEFGDLAYIAKDLSFCLYQLHYPSKILPHERFSLKGFHGSVNDIILRLSGMASSEPEVNMKTSLLIEIALKALNHY